MTEKYTSLKDMIEKNREKINAWLEKVKAMQEQNAKSEEQKEV